MLQWLVHDLSTFNLVSVLIVGLVAVSIYQGYVRGASSSAKRLLFFIAEGALTIVGIYAAWRFASWFSPKMQQWLVNLDIDIPKEKINFAKQVVYTFITGIRDFPLLRFGLLLAFGYIVLKQVLNLLFYWLMRLVDAGSSNMTSLHTRWLSRLVGGSIGSAIGFVRSVLIVALLFAYVSLMPKAPFTGYIQASQIYQKSAEEIIKPITGDWIAQQAPVLTRAVQDEFSKIVARKYEVIDYNIPDDIAAAASSITKDDKTSEEKAKSLYQWVGSRISYDDEKVRKYVEENEWMEQTPEQTFTTRKGVCIDYSRLYAVMARSVGLEVKVETGVGYDGKGGYGPHAWNVVLIAERNKWVPLDSTWAKAGDWFDPPNFYQTHVKEV